MWVCVVEVVVVVVVGFVFVEAASEGSRSILEVENRCARRRRERPQDVRESGRGRAEQRSERAQSLFIVVEHRSGERRVRSAAATGQAATRDRWLSLAGALALSKALSSSLHYDGHTQQYFFSL